MARRKEDFNITYKEGKIEKVEKVTSSSIPNARRSFLTDMKRKKRAVGIVRILPA